MTLSCFALTPSAANGIPIPTKAGSVLTDGTYTVSSTTLIYADLNSSALEIAPGATVTIVFENNALLRVWGGDSITMEGAGAGIRVPEGSTLYIMGTGKLEACGGEAGHCGLNGRNGGTEKYVIHNHYFDPDWTYNENAHWHICLREYCCYGDDYSKVEEASYGRHVGMSDGICDTCGYIDKPFTMPVTQPKSR